MTSSIQVSEEAIEAGVEAYWDCKEGDEYSVRNIARAIYLAMRSKDHSMGDDVRLDQGKIAEIIAHSMGRYPTDDPVLDATMAVIAYVNGPRLAAITAIGSQSIELRTAERKPFVIEDDEPLAKDEERPIASTMLYNEGKVYGWETPIAGDDVRTERLGEAADFYSFRPLGCSDKERDAVLDMQHNAGARTSRVTIVSEEHPLPPYPHGIYFEGFRDFWPWEVLPEFDYPLVAKDEERHA